MRTRDCVRDLVNLLLDDWISGKERVEGESVWNNEWNQACDALDHAEDFATYIISVDETRMLAWEKK